MLSIVLKEGRGRSERLFLLSSHNIREVFQYTGMLGQQLVCSVVVGVPG